MDFSFFAVIALFMLTQAGFGLAALCACGIHELSHLAFMTVFGVYADEILFYGAGIRISSQEISRTGRIQRTLILSAGSLGNIIAAAVLIMLGNYVAAAINLFTAFFNLLPIGSLDGAQLLKDFSISRCKPENVDKIMRAAEIISLVVLIAAAVCLGGFSSFSFSLIILYIVLVSCIKA